MRAQKSYIDASSAQEAALWGLFRLRFKKIAGGDLWFHSKEHSKTEFRKKNSEKKFGKSQTFYWSKFSLANGVALSAAFWQSCPCVHRPRPQASQYVCMWENLQYAFTDTSTLIFAHVLQQICTYQYRRIRVWIYIYIQMYVYIYTMHKYTYT